MIERKKLIQFYIEQYTEESRKKEKKIPRYTDAPSRMKNLQKALRRARPSRVPIQNLEDYHRQIKNMAIYAYRKKRDALTLTIQIELLPKLVDLDLGLLLKEQKERLDGEFLSYLKRKLPGALCQETLFTLYAKFRQYKVKNKILELVPSRPEMEFPEVRRMQRHFILHIGPTNSSDTFRL